MDTVSPGRYPAAFPKRPLGMSPLPATEIVPSMELLESAKTEAQRVIAKTPDKIFFIIGPLPANSFIYFCSQYNRKI